MSSSNSATGTSAVSPKNATASNPNHYGWANNIEATRQELAKLGVDNTPKPLTTTTTQTSSSSSSSSSTSTSTSSTSGSSSWNTAGTWEEKTVTAKASSLLKEALNAIQNPISSNATSTSASASASSTSNLIFKVLSTNIHGAMEVRKVFARGKTRIVFEFEEIRIEWGMHIATNTSDTASSTSDEPCFMGNISLKGVSDSDSDLFESYVVTISPPPSSTTPQQLSKEATLQLVRKQDTIFRKVIKEWVEVVKNN